MRAALGDPDLFGRVFAGESWAAWRVLLIAAMGEALDDDERAVFEALTGRPRGPAERVDELWAVIGRRGGKTRAVAVLAAYIAALCDHADKLAPGERAVLPILSASVWQAQKAFGLLAGIFDAVPALSAMVIGRTCRDDRAVERRRHRMPTGELSNHPRGHGGRHRRRRGRVLANREQPQSRQGDSRRGSALARDHRRPADCDLLALWQARRVVERLSPRLWRGRRSADPDRAGAVADGEPDIVSARRRARVRARSHGGAC